MPHLHYIDSFEIFNLEIMISAFSSDNWRSMNCSALIHCFRAFFSDGAATVFIVSLRLICYNAISMIILAFDMCISNL